MVFGALPQGKLCKCTKKFTLRQVCASYSEIIMRKDEIDQVADLFLTLWQENIRLWAAEKDLLPHRELAALLGVEANEEVDDLFSVPKDQG